MIQLSVGGVPVQVESVKVAADLIEVLARGQLANAAVDIMVSLPSRRQAPLYELVPGAMPRIVPARVSE